MVTEIDYPNMEDRFNARINDYERRIASLELSLQKFYTRDSFIFPTIADRDAASRPPYGTRVFVESTRTDYMFDGQTVGGPIVLNGVSSANQYISTPDAAVLDITGDIEFVARVAFDNWKSGSAQVFVSKDDGVSQRSYSFYIGGDGLLYVNTYAPGSILFISTAAVSFTNGTTYWVKAEIDVANGANKTATFYTAPDSETEPTGGGWTQLGSSVTTSGTTTIVATSAAVWIGAFSNSLYHASGKFYNVIIRNGIGGSIAGQMEAKDVVFNSATFASHACTWTLNNLGPGWIIMAEPEQIYVPVLNNITLGTGAYINVGRFRRSNGMIDIATELLIGVGGSLGTSPSLNLPVGITSALVVRNSFTSTEHDNDAILVVNGGAQLMSPGSAAIIPFVNTTGGAYSADSGLSATTPFTWAVNDRLTIVGCIPMRSRYM